MASKPEPNAHEPNAHALRQSAGFGLGAVCLVVSLAAHSVLAPLPNFRALLKPRPQATAVVTHAAFSEIPVDLSNDPADEDAPAPAKNVEPPVPANEVPAAHESSAESATDSVAKPRAPRAQRALGQPSTGAKSQASAPRLDVGARVSSNSSHLLGRSLVTDCSLSALIDISRVRAHPLAAQLGRLLTEWQSLFAEPGLDPVRDLDRLLVIGPELRESGRGLAVAQHHLDAAPLKTALDRVLARGAPGTPAQEHFYLQISPELLLMAPDRSSLRPIKDFVLATPPEGTLGTLYVDAPSRALANLPLEFPASVHWLRGIILATADNGVAIDIEAGDENGELAKRNARQLTRNVLALKTKGHTRLIERALFEARASVIVGRLEVTSLQLGALLEVLSDRVKAPADPPPPPEPAASASSDDESQPEQPAATPETPRAPPPPPTDAGAGQADAAAPIDGGKTM